MQPKFLLMTAYLLIVVMELALWRLNSSFQRRAPRRPPTPLAAGVADDQLACALQYNAAKTHLACCRLLAITGLVCWFLFGPGLKDYDAFIGTLPCPAIARGTLFFLSLALASILFDLPFDYYRTFCLEERYRFNTTPRNLWVRDRLKRTFLLLTFSAGSSMAALWLVQSKPENWWLWGWLAWLCFMLLLMVLSPYLLEPLFHRFTPLSRPELASKIRQLATKGGIRTAGVLQVDASRRSRHANAYFTGLGRQKRIVLYDTLLRLLEDEEILAVVAHEMGHWRRHHLRWRLLTTALIGLGVWALAFSALQEQRLAHWLGVSHLSFAGQSLFLWLIVNLSGRLLQPLAHGMARRQERQADLFACDLLTHPQHLAEALAKLATENLANLHPHPLFTWVYATHPPLAERLRVITAQKNTSAAKD